MDLYFFFGAGGVLIGIAVIINYLYRDGNLKYMEAEIKTLTTLSLIALIISIFGLNWVSSFEPEVRVNTFVASEYGDLKLDREECIKQTIISKPLSADMDKTTAEIVPMEKCRKEN